VCIVTHAVQNASKFIFLHALLRKASISISRINLKTISTLTAGEFCQTPAYILRNIFVGARHSIFVKPYFACRPTVHVLTTAVRAGHSVCVLVIASDNLLVSLHTDRHCDSAATITNWTTSFFHVSLLISYCMSSIAPLVQNVNQNKSCGISATASLVAKS